MTKEQFVCEIEKNTGVMYRVAFTLLRSDEDCKDAMAEATMKAWEKQHSLRDAERFKAWIIRILTNTCYDLMRKRKRTVPLKDIVEYAVPPPEPFLDMALQALPDKLRLPLMLYYSEGMRYGEIADALHLPLSTVRGRIHMAKAKLRKELEE